MSDLYSLCPDRRPAPADIMLTVINAYGSLLPNNTLPLYDLISILTSAAPSTPVIPDEESSYYYRKVCSTLLGKIADLGVADTARGHFTELEELNPELLPIAR